MAAIDDALELPYLGLFEATDRRVRVTNSGMEIVITYYVEPATAAPIIVTALLGSTDTSVTPPTRLLPDVDFEYPFCFCVEAHIAPQDKRTVTSSPSLFPIKAGTPPTWGDLKAKLKVNPIIFSGPLQIERDPKETGFAKKGQCGVFIEAVYRPLPTCYTETAHAEAWAWEHPEFAFDYVDPQFYPASRQFAANGYPGKANSFCFLSVEGFPTPAPNAGNNALLVTETWQEFTIRRVMCPTVPWTTIRTLQNRINGLLDWTPANMTIPGLVDNKFPIGTMRFDSAEIIRRTMPTCFDINGKVATEALTGRANLGNTDPSTLNIPVTQQTTWWDITYKFSWRTTWDMYLPYDCGFLNRLWPIFQGPGWLTWNYDWYIGAEPGQAKEGEADISVTHLPGWYEMIFEKPSNPIISFATRKKYLDAEEDVLTIRPLWNKDLDSNKPHHPFDLLFLNSSP